MLLRNRPNGKPSLFDAALAYHGRGWSIIGVIGKKAVRRWKAAQEHRPDEDQLRVALASPGVTGIAAVLGPASGGLSCRDFDNLDATLRAEWEVFQAGWEACAEWVVEQLERGGK